MDQDTLIAADYYGKQLVKYSIDRVNRTCTGQVLVDLGYIPLSVSCSQGGLVFVTEETSGVVRVRVYNVSTGDIEEVWDTNINSPSIYVHVSLGAEYIVLSAGNKNYVYNQYRALLYSVTPDQVSRSGFRQTHVTETGVFWGTVYDGFKLLIMDLSTNETKISTEGIVWARGVSGTSNGYVYVTDKNKADVGVYSADGTFLHLLHIDRPPGGGGLWYSGAVSLSPTEDLIAFFTGYDQTPIAVYRAHP